MKKLAIALVLLSGCSFAFSRGPSKTASGKSDPSSCRGGLAPAMVDAILTTGALIAVSQLDGMATVFTTPLVLVGLTFGASTVHGIGSASACGSARREAPAEVAAS